MQKRPGFIESIAETMKNKLFATIIASAFVAGSATGASAFDLNVKEDNAYDLLAFYSGQHTSTMPTYMDFLSPSGAWRILNMPSRSHYYSLGNLDLTIGGSSLVQPTLTDFYDLSFSRNNNWQSDSGFDRYGLKASGRYNLGDYYAGTGFSYSMALAGAGGPENRQRLKSMGVFMETGKRIANLTTGFMYVYVNGDDAAGSGGFRPFYLFTLASGAYRDKGVLLDQAQAISLYAGYDIGSQLSLRGGLGIAKVDERMTADALRKEESFRWAVNLDANYKLLDNLVYEAHFGFLDSASLFDDPVGGESLEPSLLPGSPVYHLINQLTMTF